MAQLEFGTDIFKATSTLTWTVSEKILQHLTNIAIYIAYAVIAGPASASVQVSGKPEFPGLQNGERVKKERQIWAFATSVTLFFQCYVCINRTKYDKTLLLDINFRNI